MRAGTIHQKCPPCRHLFSLPVSSPLPPRTFPAARFTVSLAFNPGLTVVTSVGILEGRTHLHLRRHLCLAPLRDAIPID